ncbi:MAG: endonuclease/exonuclease/phosphatase family protein, partial [Eubacteriales bacterium]
MIKPLKIVTFNLRCAWSEDGANSFVHRAGLIWEKMRAEAPDVVALQEVMPKSLAILKLLMPDYEFFGQGRNADFGGEGLYT